MGRSNHKKITRPLCGCGQQVKKVRSRFIQGHSSRLCTGEKNSFFGKTHTKFARQSIRESLIRRNKIMAQKVDIGVKK